MPRSAARPRRPRLSDDGSLHPSERLERGVYWEPVAPGEGPEDRLTLLAVDRQGREVARATLVVPDAFPVACRQLREQLEDYDPGADLQVVD